MIFRIKIVLFFILFAVAAVFSQTTDTTDFRYKIKKATTDSKSEFYFKKLLDKLANNPKDINSKDCFYLYYGQIVQKEISQLTFVMKSEGGDIEKLPTQKDCSETMQIDYKVLEKKPLSLTALLHVSNCIKEKNYPDTTYFLDKRYRNLVKAILSSGDGKTKNTAIRIVDAEDIYVIKGILGFFAGDRSFIYEDNHTYSVWERDKQSLFFETLMSTPKK